MFCVRHGWCQRAQCGMWHVYMCICHLNSRGSDNNNNCFNLLSTYYMSLAVLWAFMCLNSSRSFLTIKLNLPSYNLCHMDLHSQVFSSVEPSSWQVVSASEISHLQAKSSLVFSFQVDAIGSTCYLHVLAIWWDSGTNQGRIFLLKLSGVFLNTKGVFSGWKYTFGVRL